MENQTDTRQYRASAEQRLQMIEQFHSSGLTQAAFCKQSGISLPTLSYWLRKTRPASEIPPPVLFNEVKLAAPGIAQPNTWALEITAPSGMTIRSRDQYAIQDLAQLLR
jgi:transposase-like protein